LSLPHRFPFRLVDGVDGRRAIVRVSAGSYWLRGAATAPLAILVEAAAQGAALLFEAGVDPTVELRLAGLEEVTLDRLPIAGETIEIEARIERRLGPATRVRAELRRDGLLAGRATLILIGGS
jgi:hypothetical protein